MLPVFITPNCRHVVIGLREQCELLQAHDHIMFICVPQLGIWYCRTVSHSCSIHQGNYYSSKTVIYKLIVFIIEYI